LRPAWTSPARRWPPGHERRSGTKPRPSWNAFSRRTRSGLAYQARPPGHGPGRQAEEMLRQARASDPNRVDAYVHLALVYARPADGGGRARGDRRRGEPVPWTGGGPAAPAGRLRQNVRAKTWPRWERRSAGDPHAGLDGPGAAGAAAPRPECPPAPSTGRRRRGVRRSRGAKRTLSGVVELDQPSRVVNAPGILFVFVREAGLARVPGRGPALPVSSFPMGFEIGGRTR
jgi:hypothetical protein